MPDLLFELFSEEIPARMQKQAAEDLKRLVTNALVDRGLAYEGARAFATPRRLALNIVGLPARQPDTREEKKGPRISAPEAARLGFLKSIGVPESEFSRFDLYEGHSVSLPERGLSVEVRGAGKDATAFALIERKGGATLDVLAEVLPAVIRAFPWPKSMRWGVASREPGSLRWVRPLRGIVAMFGAETEEPEVVPFDVDGLKAGNVTRGHRFMAGAPIQVRRFDDYTAKLEAAKVVLDAERRKEIIRHDARTLASAQLLEVIEDEGLLEEVAGLVEWPVVLMGAFEEEFLDVPAEVIRATIRANQKCFVLRRADGALANKFLMVANIAAKDGGKTIIAGNERVIRARLSDAKFFWETDKKVWKDDPEFKRLEKFKNVTFHEKLGSQWDRIERIRALAKELCKVTGADEAEVDLAARICKADLLTEVVGEFPEVQGLMGRKYAAIFSKELGISPSAAAASEEHYKPVGPNDSVPKDKVSVTVALADKLDTLVGFWAIDEKPTGSKDPYALRRAALGVIRLVVENRLRAPIVGMATFALLGFPRALRQQAPSQLVPTPREALERAIRVDITSDLLSFFHDRLKVMLRDSGARHDLVDAVLANGETNDDLLLVVRRVEALGTFLETEDGRNLLAGYKRAANILRAEEKKTENGKTLEGAFEAAANPALLAEAAERALHDALSTVGEAASVALQKQDFEAAMRAMARLRTPVDAFFDAVMVNAEDPAIRVNRLALLAALRRVTRQVADFGKIAG